MSKKQQIIYYENESSDFAGISKNTISIDENFKYTQKNPIWHFLAFIVYRIIMKPFAFLWCKMKFSIKIENKALLKSYRKKGYFLFSNHTLMASDAFIPNILDYNKRTYVVVHPDNISTKGTKNFIMMCGAIPIPTSFGAFRPFLKTLKDRIDNGNMICIYPEAHLWPYCTFIRNFSDISFSYPIKCDCPVFSSTTTFQKKKFGKFPKVTVYIDGPFIPDKNSNPREAQAKLRNEVYNTMCERAKRSTYEIIKYQKKEI